MVASAQATAKKPKRTDIPAELVYETMDGRPIYYNGYRDVLRGEKTLDDIMATGVKQTRLLNIIQQHLYRHPKTQDLEIMVGEIGLHISTGNNLSLDMVIFEQSVLAALPINNNYFNVPPKIVIEVDTLIDSTSINLNQYILKKTRKLTQFGVEKVIWLFTEPPLISVAEANGNWQIYELNKPIEVVMGVTVNFSDLFKSKGIFLDSTE